MARKSICATLFLVIVTAATLREGTAATYVVGDSLGWMVPSGGATVYSNWSSQHNFTTGDILVFNFLLGQHDLARVTKEAYDICNSTSPISLQTVGPANFSLSSTGEYYFICTFGQHCVNGQKLSINVSSTSGASPTASPPASPPTSSSSAPSPAPSPAPSTTSPPPPPAATSPPSSSPPPGSTPTPPSNTTSPPPPPPPPSSASSKAVASFAIFFMTIALGVLF